MLSGLMSLKEEKGLCFQLNYNSIWKLLQLNHAKYFVKGKVKFLTDGMERVSHASQQPRVSTSIF
jgi:hypothetical protein